MTDPVKARIVFEAELRAVDPEGLSFININTPEEYQITVGRWQSRSVLNSTKPALLG